MKMNWGSWIVVCFVLFAIGTLTLVYISISTSVDLVTDDYYEKELRYQDHIELVKSTNALEQTIELDYTTTSLVFKYPVIGSSDNYSGSVHFFRPSDKRGDFIREIKIDSAYSQEFPNAIFAKGFWRAKISWNAGDRQYYSELPIIIR